ncbi:hypothetical protein [Streptomyces sp. NPDC090025]|uniref:hypothetical protein n=1 Tax=Streptomyces sp. NPDC090025 TaxID=3365922 RepID=UPI00383697FF
MNEDGTGGPGRLGVLVGAIAAPTSLVTALLYYFGYWHAYWFFAYFRVNSTLLGLGTTDYLLRSLDALWVPLTVTATAGLVALWGHDLVRRRLAVTGAGPRALRRVTAGVAGAGLLPTVGGLWSTFSPTFLNRVLTLAPLSLSAGVALLAYARRLERLVAARAPEPRPDTPGAPGAPAEPAEPAEPVATVRAAGPEPVPVPATTPPQPPPAAPVPPSPPAPRPAWAELAELAVVFLLVGLGVVWAANDYAASVGVTRAQRFVAGLSAQPSVVVYSERGLGIGGPGVRETRCRDAKAAYAYRYDGLVLILQSGNQYVLLPASWTQRDGVALVLPRNDTLRLEFGPPPAARSGPSPVPSC